MAKTELKITLVMFDPDDYYSQRFGEPDDIGELVEELRHIFGDELEAVILDDAVRVE